MPNILLTRIDNRLIHGQVATQWCGSIGANLILVANILRAFFISFISFSLFAYFLENSIPIMRNQVRERE